jgi:hypothetical protein
MPACRRGGLDRSNNSLRPERQEGRLAPPKSSSSGSDCISNSSGSSYNAGAADAQARTTANRRKENIQK